MKYERHPTIDHYLNKVRVHTEPYNAEILGKEIIILPGVMSPKYDRSSRIFIEMMSSQKGKSFLDIGCGTGIVSLFAGIAGASRIVAVDINENAVENAQVNFKKSDIQNADAFISDLFMNVHEKFDTIFFNAPFHGNEPRDILESGTSDYNYRTLRSFFSHVKEYVKDEGKILLGFSDMGDNDLVMSLISQNNLKIDTLQKQQNGDWTAYLYTLSSV